jgi:hypothetical protein
VGNSVLNSAVFTTLPAFHFRGDRFSKTCTGFIHAACWVSGLLSTFPVTTITTTNKGWINFGFYRSSSFAPWNPQEEACERFSRAFAVV